MKTRITLLLLLLGSIFILPSCLPEFNFDADDLDEKWDPGFAIPLLNTELTLQNALDNFSTGGFITQDSDNLLTVVYRSSSFSILGGQFFSLPDMPIPLLDSVQNVPAPFPGNTALDNITLEGGQLKVGLAHLETQAVTVTVTLPDLTIGGLPYSQVYNMPASDGMSPVSVLDSIDLTDFGLSFEGGDFKTEYEAISGGQRILLPSAYIEMTNLDYSYIDGYFSTSNLNLPSGQQTLDLFANWQQGNIQFEDPKFILNFRNSYGLPIRINIDSLSVNTNFNGTVNFQSQDITNGIDLNFPALGFPGVATTSITLNNQNSNINDLLSNVPYDVFYNLGATINPDDDSNIDNFLTDSSRLEVDIDMELPMYGNIGLFTLKDTFAFDMSEYQELSRMGFKVITENGFPFEVGMQAYFLDGAGVTVDSLFTGGIAPILAAASVDGNGVVTNRVTSTNEASFDHARFDILKNNVSQMVIVGTLITTDNGNTPVKVFSDYGVKIQLGGILAL